MHSPEKARRDSPEKEPGRESVRGGMREERYECARNLPLFSVFEEFLKRRRRKSLVKDEWAVGGHKWRLFALEFHHFMISIFRFNLEIVSKTY